MFKEVTLIKPSVLNLLLALIVGPGVFYSKPSLSYSCKNVLTKAGYKPKKFFSNKDLIAFDRLAVGLLSVKIARDEVKGLSRGMTSKSDKAEPISYDSNKLAKELHTDLLNYLSGEKITSKAPLRPFVLEGYEDSFLRKQYNRLLSTMWIQPTQKTYPRLSELYDLIRTDASSLEDFREYIKANLDFTVENALTLRRNHKIWDLIKYTFSSGALSAPLSGLKEYLSGPIDGLDILTESVVAGFVIGSILVVNKHREAIYMSVPSLTAPLKNTEESNMIRSRFSN